jgi:hypothetical protein
MAMAADWHPLMGFEVLTLHLFWSVTFASLSGHPITDKDTVNIGVCILNHTGLFPKEYKMWILCDNDASKTNNFVSFKTFWEDAVQIAGFTAVPVSQHGYGTAATYNNALAQSLMDAVSNFGTAYATTQELLQSNTANILAMQGQLQMLCQAVGNGQSPQQQPRCPRGGHGCGQQCGGHNGGGDGSGGGGGSSYNIGSGSYNGGGGGSSAYGGGYICSGSSYSGGYGSGYGSSNVGHQTPSSLPPLSVYCFENWNYWFMHGSNVDNNHTSATCTCPGENHQRAVTRTNTMDGTMCGMK